MKSKHWGYLALCIGVPTLLNIATVYIGWVFKNEYTPITLINAALWSVIEIICIIKFLSCHD